MRVLVTGGAGFIGSHTVDALLAKGYEVTIIDSLQPPVHPSPRWPSYISKEVRLIRGNVCNSSHMRKALEGADAVFHLAAQQDSLPDFSRFAKTNEHGTALLYELIIKGNLPVKKIVVASSQAVYGEGRYICPQHGDVLPGPRSQEQLMSGEWDLSCPDCSSVIRPEWTDETTLPKPGNHYAVSKYSQELWALTLGRRYGIPTVALRYSITQGPRQSPFNAYSGVLRNFATQLLGGQPATIYEDGRQLRDYVHVTDASDANLLALEDDGANFQTFNVGGNKPTSVLEYYDLIAKHLGTEIRGQIPGKFRSGDVRNIFSDSKKLRNLGWKGSRDVGLIVRDYLDWLSKMGRIPQMYPDAEKVLSANRILLDVRRG